MIKLGRGIELPDEAVTQTFGILAKRGAGKSNTAAVMAEGMYDAGLQFVVVDPVGAWWGLRSSSDGKSSGLPVPIFGGYRGDVPLEPTAGALIADLVVDERLSCVLDVGAFDTQSAKRRFLTAFAERLFQRKGQPGNEEPLHLFLEEADDYAPQRVSGVEANRLLGSFQRIVKQGRARGLGSTMITQRSAVLNKDLLTQIETLIVLRTTSPQDRKAIQGWVEHEGLAAELLASLSSLVAGEAWLWSPSWLERVERVKIRRRRTFDSGSTPTAKGTGRRVATLADVDLGELETAMKETIERAKESDPKELRARIAELERELAKQPVEVKPEIVEVEISVLEESDRQAVVKLLDVTNEVLAAMSVMQPTLDLQRNQLQKMLERVDHEPVPQPAPVRREREPAPKPRSIHDEGSRARARLSNPQQRILDAVAWWNACGIAQPTKVQVGMIAGYRVGKRVGGTFGNLLGQLRTDDLLEYPAPGAVELTQVGKARAAVPVSMPTTAELQAAVMDRLAEPERRVLAAVLGHYPASDTKQSVGERSGYAVGARVGGTFGNILGRLRSLGLVEYPAPGSVVASSWLFLDWPRTA